AKIREAVSMDAGQGPDLDPALAWASFMSAMNDDLDSPSAERILVNFADEVLEAGMQGRNIKPAQEALREMSGVFGVRLDTRDAQSGGSEGWDQHLKRFLGEEKVST
ncbi:MAG TPA: DALR domain-containing protein, partial [Anaerolineales bacterium]